MDFERLMDDADMYRRRMQYQLDTNLISGRIDEVSVYFKTEMEVRAFINWARRYKGYVNPITDVSPYYDVDKADEPARADRHYDRIVLMEFLYPPELWEAEWHFEVRTYLGWSDIPEYLQVPTGTVLFGSAKYEREVYQETVEKMAEHFGEILRMFHVRYGVCSDVGIAGNTPYYHARTRSPDFRTWVRE